MTKTINKRESGTFLESKTVKTADEFHGQNSKNERIESATTTTEQPTKVGLIISNGTQISRISVPTIPKNRFEQTAAKTSEIPNELVPNPISYDDFKEKSKLVFSQETYQINTESNIGKVNSN